MEVLRATVTDAEDILSLQRTAYLSEARLHDDYDIPPLTQTLDSLMADFEHKTILKIVDNDTLLASGQVRFHDDCSYIGRMAVRPEFQGRGIGSSVLSALEREFPQAKRLELFTGENSVGNLALYQRRGYVPFKTALLGKTNVIFLRRYV